MLGFCGSVFVGGSRALRGAVWGTPIAQRRGRQYNHGLSSVRMIRGFPNEFNNSPNAEGKERLIGELVDFPCVFIFKIIGTNEGAFVEDILDSVASCVKIDSGKLKYTFKDKGRYRSISLEVPCNSADQVYNIYAAIDRDPRVKFKF